MKQIPQFEPEEATEIERRHREACARGEDTYDDPKTGRMVFTESYLLFRGYCCNSGCRHCPYRDK